jgi:hypothetical protein
LVTAEARLAVMLSGDREDHRLIGPEHLAEAARCAEAALRSLGIELDAPAVVRRLDPASELLFESAREGLAFLAACERGLQLPRLKQAPIRALNDARLETITWRTPKGNLIKVRLYDAGALHGTRAPGERLRLEREHRWQGQKAPTPESLAVSHLGAIFRAPLEPWLRQSIPVAVTTPSKAVSRLFELRRTGCITRREARSLSASVNVLVYELDLLRADDRRRRVRKLREVGIALDLLGEAESLDIDLREPLVALLGPWERAAEVVR